MSLSAVPTEAMAVRRGILLQIDAPVVTKALREVLADAGYDVHAASQFKDLAAWLLLHRDATLVIALPAIDFFRKAVLREVKRLSPTVRIIALAPSVTIDVERDAQEANAAGVLPSSATPEAIIELINKICN
jgi:DNA-binding NarL/FixJ family response regulator